MTKEPSIIVTGATGYIGSHFCKFLSDRDINALILGRQPRTIRERLCHAQGLQTLPDTMKILEHNESISSMSAALEPYQDSPVIHLAGLFVSRHTPNDVAPLIDANVLWPTKLFEAMKAAGLRRIVNIGTLWESDHQGETHPANLYAATKIANTNLLEYYALNEGFQAIALKLLDTYGGHDPRKKLLALLKKLTRPIKN